MSDIIFRLSNLSPPRQHIDIIDAILAGKAAQAEKSMRIHVRRAGVLAQAIPGLE